MDTGVISLILRALLLFLSFTGLSAFVRSTLKLNRFIAPMFTSSAVIIVLMLSGMLGMLQAGFLLLYIGGFASLIYTYIIRRIRPDFALIALMGALCIYLGWRCFSCPLRHSDDFSHWALVASYILDNNAFPDAAAQVIRFQSYPVGTASFIYYIAHSLGNHEGLYALAQHLLEAFALLPMLALIEGNRKYLYPVFAVGYVFLITRNPLFINLQVDWILAHYATGAIAAIFCCHRDIKKAVLVSLPAMIVLIYMKNSGMFFAFCILLMLLISARRQKVSGRGQLLMLFGCAAAAAGAYLLWNLHISIAYPAAESSKHAVSLTAYSQNLNEKGLSVIVKIAKMMVKYLLNPDARILLAFLLFGAISAALIAGCLMIPGQRAYLRTVIGGLLCSAGVFALWYAMLFFMYVFSMPLVEAINLASISRYTSTGLTLLSGLGLILLFAFYGRKTLVFPRVFRGVYVLAAAVCLIALVLRFPASNISAKLFTRETQPIPERAQLQDAREALDLPANAQLLLYMGNPAWENTIDTIRYVTMYRHTAAYEFNTPNIDAVFQINAQDFDSVGPMIFYDSFADAGYGCQTHSGSSRFSDDPAELMLSLIDEADAVIFLHDNDALISELTETYTGDTPIYHSFE